MNKKHLNWIFFGIIGLACMPMAIDYFLRMWNAERYRHAVLVWGVVGFLLWRKRNELAKKFEPPSTPIFAAILGCCWIALTIATLFATSFFGAIALVSFAVATVYWLFGKAGFRECLPILGLLVFAIPVPFRMDESLIINMQFISSRMASWMLDSVGTIHFREGVVLFTEHEDFATARACSGVRSLFSSLAGVYLFCVLASKRWWVIGLNLMQTVIWVLIANAIRVAVVVYTSDIGISFFASGIGHELLGVLVFFFVLGMTFSMHHMVRAFGRKSGVSPKSIAKTTSANPQSSNHPTVALTPIPKFLFSFGVLFLLVGLLGGRLIQTRFFETESSGLRAIEYPIPELDDMPTSIGSWTRMGFEHVQRGENGIRAEDSFIWTYGKDRQRLQLSIDAPWTQWHNLEFCYDALGWDCSRLHKYSSSTSDGYTTIQMGRTSGEKGFVAFSAVDYQSEPVLPPDILSSRSMFQRAADTMSIAFGVSRDVRSDWRQIALPVSQLQLFYSSSGEIDSQLDDELEKFYVEARSQLLKTSFYRSDSVSER